MRRAALVVNVFIRLAIFHRVVIGASLFFVAFSSTAKCPLVIYEVRGKVVQEGTYNPLGDREVVGFFDDYRQSIGKQRAVTNSRGEFVLRGAFDSYKGYTWWGHNCGKKPELLEIIVFGVQGSERRKYTRGEMPVLTERGQALIDLPTFPLKQ